MGHRTRGNKDVKLPKVQKVECTLEYKNFKGLILAIIMKYNMILQYALKIHTINYEFTIGDKVIGNQKYKFKIKPIIKIVRAKDDI